MNNLIYLAFINLLNFIKINWKNITIIILVILLLFLNFTRTNQYKYQEAIIDSLTLANQESKQIINKTKQIVTTQQVIITKNEGDLKEMTDSIFNLKKRDERRIKQVEAFYKERWKYSIDSVLIKFKEPDEEIPINVPDSCSEILQKSLKEALLNHIRVPKTIQYDSSNYLMDLTVLKEGIRINNFQVSDTQSIRVVSKKNGLFKPKTLEIQTLHSNPNIKVLGQNSIIYKPKPKRNIVLKIAILAAGVYLGSKL